MRRILNVAVLLLSLTTFTGAEELEELASLLQSQHRGDLAGKKGLAAPAAASLETPVGEESETFEELASLLQSPQRGDLAAKLGLAASMASAAAASLERSLDSVKVTELGDVGEEFIAPVIDAAANASEGFGDRFRKQAVELLSGQSVVQLVNELQSSSQVSSNTAAPWPKAPTFSWPSFSAKAKYRSHWAANRGFEIALLAMVSAAAFGVWAGVHCELNGRGTGVGMYVGLLLVAFVSLILTTMLSGSNIVAAMSTLLLFAAFGMVLGLGTLYVGVGMEATEPCMPNEGFCLENRPLAQIVVNIMTVPTGPSKAVAGPTPGQRVVFHPAPTVYIPPQAKVIDIQANKLGEVTLGQGGWPLDERDRRSGGEAQLHAPWQGRPSVKAEVWATERGWVEREMVVDEAPTICSDDDSERSEVDRSEVHDGFFDLATAEAGRRTRPPCVNTVTIIQLQLAGWPSAAASYVLQCWDHVTAAIVQALATQLAVAQVRFDEVRGQVQVVAHGAIQDLCGVSGGDRRNALAQVVEAALGRCQGVEPGELAVKSTTAAISETPLIRGPPEHSAAFSRALEAFAWQRPVQPTDDIVELLVPPKDRVHRRRPGPLLPGNGDSLARLPSGSDRQRAAKLVELITGPYLYPGLDAALRNGDEEGLQDLGGYARELREYFRFDPLKQDCVVPYLGLCSRGFAVGDEARTLAFLESLQIDEQFTFQSFVSTTAIEVPDLYQGDVTFQWMASAFPPHKGAFVPAEITKLSVTQGEPEVMWPPHIRTRVVNVSFSDRVIWLETCEAPSIWDAVYNGHVNAVATWAQKNPQRIRTACCKASMIGEVASRAAQGLQGGMEMLEILLEHGADPSEPGPDGIQPLEIAIRKGHTRAIKMLLQAGASMQLLEEAIRDSAPAFADALQKCLEAPGEVTMGDISPLLPDSSREAMFAENEALRQEIARQQSLIDDAVRRRPGPMLQNLNVNSPEPGQELPRQASTATIIDDSVLRAQVPAVPSFASPPTVVRTMQDEVRRLESWSTPPLVSRTVQDEVLSSDSQHTREDSQHICDYMADAPSSPRR